VNIGFQNRPVTAKVLNAVLVEFKLKGNEEKTLAYLREIENLRLNIITF